VSFDIIITGAESDEIYEDQLLAPSRGAEPVTLSRAPEHCPGGQVVPSFPGVPRFQDPRIWSGF
jgi:hypothetical protein